MAVTVSLINMKGGVGKTTIAAQLAYSADRRKFRTLIVDLDPQSNLSQVILNPERYVKLLKDKNPTVYSIFEGYLPPSDNSDSPKQFDIQDVIIKKVGYEETTTLDLIPSRLELSQTLKNPAGKERRLAEALSKISSHYDLILIDCAPTESILTKAAYYSSRYALVPVKPEFMATVGLPLLARSITEFKSENNDHSLDICGIVFNYSSSYSESPENRKAVREVKKEAKKNRWGVYNTKVRYSASYPKAAREGTPIEKTSYVRWDVPTEFSAFVDEFLMSVGLMKTKP